MPHKQGITPITESQLTATAGTAAGLGFSAWVVVSDTDTDTNAVINFYTDCSFKTGEHFSQSTGMFTAPVAGTFVACIKICKWKDKDGLARVRVICRRAKSEKKIVVCEASSTLKNVSMCDIGLVQLEAGDLLYAEWVWSEHKIDTRVVFSCFMVR